MFTTGILLIVCGIPGTGLCCILMLRKGYADITYSEALSPFLYMILVEAFIACILLFLAQRFTKRQNTNKQRSE